MTSHNLKYSPAHHTLKAHHRSWTWSSYAGAWLLRSSRHRRPKLGDMAVMERTLTELGYTVTRDIDEAMPTVEQQETDLADRMDARADRLADRADTRRRGYGYPREGRRGVRQHSVRAADDARSPQLCR